MSRLGCCTRDVSTRLSIPWVFLAHAQHARVGRQAGCVGCARVSQGDSKHNVEEIAPHQSLATGQGTSYGSHASYRTPFDGKRKTPTARTARLKYCPKTERAQQRKDLPAQHHESFETRGQIGSERWTEAVARSAHHAHAHTGASAIIADRGGSKRELLPLFVNILPDTVLDHPKNGRRNAETQ